MRRIAATLAVVGALLFSAGSAWADWDDAVAAHKRGDYATALREFRPFAEQGDADAQNDLGFMYANGVPQNYAEAVKWYRKAAEQGVAEAQFNLGVMYANGRGVLQDTLRSHMWSNIASANGHKNGGINRDIDAKSMTPTQIEKAQDMARQCMDSGYTDC